MLMIRLARGGSKHRPFFHIRAADKRNSRDGLYKEQLGYFNPLARGEEKRLVINRARIAELVTQGAKVSDRVARLVRDDEIGEEAVTARKEVKKNKVAKRKATKKAASTTPAQPVAAAE